MKKMLPLLVVVLALQTATASTIYSSDTIPSVTKEDYLLKSKRQRTGAILCLTGGILSTVAGGVMVIGGSTIFFVETIGSGISGEQPDNRAKNITNAGVALLLLGTAGIITSIILFNNSGKTKKMALSMTCQPVQQLQYKSVANKIVPSVRFTIDL